MSKGLIFFCCACAILIFTIINLSVGPIVSGTVKTFDGNWGTLNCQQAKDYYDEQKKDSQCDDDCLKYGAEWSLNVCQRKKGMHDMEYTSFIFNMVIGFVCGLLGLLHLFDAKKELVSKTGIIGLGCGIIGFIFSFVYVILNGLVYTTVDTGIPKSDSDGVYAERIGSGPNFKCLYNDKPNHHAIYATISDLIQKQYNYDKDLIESIASQTDHCVYDAETLINSPSLSAPHPSICAYSDETINPGTTYSDCKYLYVSPTDQIINKDLSDRFLTTLLLSLFVCLANIGLAIFGFLLFRTPSEF